MDLLMASMAKNRTELIASSIVSLAAPAGAATAEARTTVDAFDDRRETLRDWSLARRASAAVECAAAADIVREVCV